MPDIKYLRYRAYKLSGVTLLELAIGTAIAIIISSLSIFMLIQTSKGLKEARTISSTDYELSKAYTILKRQIISIYNPSYKDSENNFRIDKSLDGQTDLLIFYTQASYLGKGTVTSCYYIDSDTDGRKRLCYGEFPYPIELSDSNIDEMKRKSIVISEAITGFSASSINNGTKSDENSLDIPEEISIRLFYKEDNEDKYFEFKARPKIKWQ